MTDDTKPIKIKLGGFSMLFLAVLAPVLLFCLIVFILFMVALGIFILLLVGAFCAVMAFIEWIRGM